MICCANLFGQIPSVFLKSRFSELQANEGGKESDGRSERAETEVSRLEAKLSSNI